MVGRQSIQPQDLLALTRAAAGTLLNARALIHTAPVLVAILRVFAKRNKRNQGKENESTHGYILTDQLKDALNGHFAFKELASFF